MTIDPVVQAIRAARLKLLTEANGNLDGVMHRVREHEFEHPEGGVN